MMTKRKPKIEFPGIVAMTFKEPNKLIFEVTLSEDNFYEAISELEKLAPQEEEEG